MRFFITLLLSMILIGCNDESNQSFLAVERTQGMVFGETVWGEGNW